MFRGSFRLNEIIIKAECGFFIETFSVFPLTMDFSK